MPLVNTLELVTAARGRGYAVPAINIVDPLTIKAVVEAADSVGSPVILQTSVKTVKSAGAGVLHFAAKDAAERASVGVSLHLDHCPDRSMITHAIEHGWGSVLFDASDRDLAQARKETTEVCREAHDAGATVESEIENIIGVEDGVGSDEARHSYTVEQLVEVALETGTDLMAPQLGTAHGMYTAQPVLLPERVRQIGALCDRPVVLHGGTGLSNAEFDEFIDAGVTKINISTALKRAYMKSALEYLKECEATNKWEPTKLFDPMIEASKQLLIGFADIFHSAGRDGAGKDGAQ
ncbi:MAG: class II fructose-bisphosphate aldolase [Micropruina sp.]